MHLYIYTLLYLHFIKNVTNNILKEKTAKNLKTRSPNYLHFLSKSKATVNRNSLANL